MPVKGEKDTMKPLSYVIIILILVLSACKKTHHSSAAAGEWQLIQKDWSIGAGSWTLAPKQLQGHRNFCTVYGIHARDQRAGALYIVWVLYDPQ